MHESGETGDGDHVGPEPLDAGELVDHPPLVDDRPDVQVAHLDEPLALQARRQTHQGQRPLHDLRPVRLHTPRVQQLCLSRWPQRPRRSGTGNAAG